MAYILGSIPFMRCKVRREFTTDLQRHHGEYVDAIAHAVRCIRGQSLQFQVNLLDPFGGAAWMLPIDALVWKECPQAGDDMTYVAPWDVQSETFGVCELDFVKRGAVQILPKRTPGQYRFTVSFGGSDLAEDAAQMKSLHVCYLENGLIGCFPNNRVLWSDPAFWDVMDQKPDFESLHYEARAEGNQHLFRREPPKSNGHALPKAHHSDPAERPGWQQ